MSALDNIFDGIDAIHRKQDARVAAQRDGTPEGELKASYLEQIYHRNNLKTGLKILADAHVPESLLEEKRQEIVAVGAKIAELEDQLEAAGIHIRKVVRR